VALGNASPRDPAKPAPSSSSHVVKSGETPSQIAERYGMTTKELMAINGIKDPRRIRAGQKLKVGGKAAEAAPQPRAKQPAAEKGDAPVQMSKGQPGTPIRLADASASKKSARETTYKVKDGETLWDIARRHNVTIADLQSWNNLSDPSTVRSGTTLKILKN
jgi:LysM repeat protein